MLHIILEILKWIGIVLLAVLSLILLCLLAVLFVPVRYKVKGQYESEADADVTVSWLFHLIHLNIRFRQKLSWQVRIFGILFMGSEKQKKAKKQKKVKEQEKNRSCEENHSHEENQTSQEEMIPEKMISEKTISEEIPISQPESETMETDEKAEKKKMNPIKKIFFFIRDLSGKIIAMMRNIRYTIKRFCDRIKHILNHITYYHDVIMGEEGQEAVRLIKTELGKLLSHIAPKKCRIAVTFGFEDPATTGQIMAVLGVFYPIWSYDISIHPDFENTGISGNVYVRGRIRLFTLLKIAWKVYFNKNLKRVLVLLQKGGREHG